MNTHDVLAYAVATEAVKQIRQALTPWSPLFSTDVYATSSRDWPVPDFVVVDSMNDLYVAGEFKPPDQSKREYLTGLGQATAYTYDFHYGLLVVPDIADDGYRIADHISAILDQDIARTLPVGLLSYDPATISSTSAAFTIRRPLTARAVAPTHRASADQSFWAKWRDISPHELGLFLEYLYDEGRTGMGGAPGTIRDRAFDRLWADMVAGRTLHFGGQVRNISNTGANQTAWGKNYRNFITHIGWCLADGKLTQEGLSALHVVHQYGATSRLFLDHLANAVLIGGKHLVLINAINQFQDVRYQTGPFPDEGTHLDEVESNLEDVGYLKRNPGRSAAAVKGVERGFLKAEKTLWRNLGFIVGRGAHGGRAYHSGRGFMFDWSRITSLLA